MGCEPYKWTSTYERDMWMRSWCADCVDQGVGCTILEEATRMSIRDYRYPREVVRRDGKPACLAFERPPEKVERTESHVPEALQPKTPPPPVEPESKPEPDVSEEDRLREEIEQMGFEWEE